VLGPTPQGVTEGGGDEEEIADVDEEEEAAGVARDGMIAEDDTETVTRSATDTETQIEM